MKKYDEFELDLTNGFAGVNVRKLVETATYVWDTLQIVSEIGKHTPKTGKTPTRRCNTVNTCRTM